MQKLLLDVAALNGNVHEVVEEVKIQEVKLGRAESSRERVWKIRLQ